MDDESCEVKHYARDTLGMWLESVTTCHQHIEDCRRVGLAGILKCQGRYSSGIRSVGSPKFGVIDIVPRAIGRPIAEFLA